MILDDFDALSYVFGEEWTATKVQGAAPSQPGK
jgi:hypothetical protein